MATSVAHRSSGLKNVLCCSHGCRRQLKCDGTRAETRFRLSAKRTGPFKSARASVQSTTGSRGVRISGSNAGYSMFRDSVKGTGYPFHSTVSPSLPLTCVTVCHHFSNWSLTIRIIVLSSRIGPRVSRQAHLTKSTLQNITEERSHLSLVDSGHAAVTVRLSNNGNLSLCHQHNTSEGSGQTFLLIN